MIVSHSPHDSRGDAKKATMIATNSKIGHGGRCTPPSAGRTGPARHPQRGAVVLLTASSRRTRRATGDQHVTLDMARGDLRIYLGAAPRRRQDLRDAQRGPARATSAGTDVVVGFVETHGRARTAEQIGDLEVVPRRQIEYRGRDVRGDGRRRGARPAARRRARRRARAHERPGLAATRSAGRTSSELLDAGIDVISTLNIQHLESVNDVVERITGVKQRETIPDDVVRRADQIELVDMTPEALRRRMAHGNVYKSERSTPRSANYFRPGNLAALRELALLWLADRVDEGARASTASATASPSRGRRASGCSSRSPARPAPRR